MLDATKTINLERWCGQKKDVAKLNAELSSFNEHMNAVVAVGKILKSNLRTIEKVNRKFYS